MLNQIPLALLLEVIAQVSASPVDATIDAAHPTITQRAELFVREAPLSLVGYYTITDAEGNEWITSSEKPGSVATFRDSTLVDWCNESSEYLSLTCPSAYWTSCDGSTLMSEGGSSPCTGTSTCDYDIIYTGSETDASSSLRWYHCIDRSYLQFYREVPSGTLIEDATSTDATSTESSSESSADSSSTETAASPASTGSSVASQTKDPTSSPTPTPKPSTEPVKEKESSKAWIAGVVIGIVGLLAVAGMGFYLWRRRNSHAYGPAPQGPPLGPPQAHIQPGYPLQQTAYYPPQQAIVNGPSSYLQPVSPNMGAYDAQTAKPQENSMYGGYGAQQHGPPPGVGTVQMPQSSPQMQPQMAANVHELPELASSSGR